jgi:hypothetical protein
MYIDIIAKSLFKLIRGRSFFAFGVLTLSGISVTTSMQSSSICLSIGISFEDSGSIYILKALVWINGYLGDDRRETKFASHNGICSLLPVRSKPTCVELHTSEKLSGREGVPL